MPAIRPNWWVPRFPRYVGGNSAVRRGRLAEIWAGGEYVRPVERTKWTDERIDDSVGRIEGDLKELRQLVYYLWGSMLIGFMVVIATILLGNH